MLVRVRNVGARAFMRESGLSMHLLLVSHGNGRAGRGHDDERYLCLAGSLASTPFSSLDQNRVSTYYSKLIKMLQESKIP